MRRQHDSAHHYIDRPFGGTALQESVQLTAKLFHFPMAQINLMDADLEYTIAAVGTGVGPMPRADSLCHQVVRDGKTLVLADIEHIPASARELDIQAYIGVPIVGREGLVVGTLCLLDTVPRPFSPQQILDLEAVAAVVRDQLELMRRLGPVPTGTAADSAALAGAVELGQIVPFYQPVVDLRSGEVRSIEALARWHHPDRGILMPAAFIPLAEDSDIIIDLDLAVIRQATIDLARWQRRTPDLRLNVNLSARHFDHLDCVSRLTGVVTSAGVSPESVNFEVTETAALAAHPGDRSFLGELRGRGFRIVLDDFGTGFSSMEQVMRLPIDGIKLDRSVTAALGSRVGDAVVRALLGLAGDLGFDTVIEGVETAEQAARARRSGCTHGQGFLFAAPLPANDVLDHLRSAG
ncbi:EAL domain-containing protein (putative c-di-GMP-specific phosphodiesterase class I) [Nakamurella sp. UYEF19]|uniref:sensor domain-containing phosphodiesterase n=1 Tax=Nakamurella sp. UYEF19 TaxID=1756392 RepID=UPI00339891F2